MTFNFSSPNIGRSLYGQSARFDTARPLDDDDLRRLAPSIFAQEAHESRSQKFVPVPTIEVVNGLRNEGFFPVGAKQALTRIEGKAPYTKHLLRFRRFDEGQRKVGDSVLEMYLKNANDGTSAYELLAGLYRIVCMNSLVAHTDTVDTVKVRHNGKAVVDDVIEGTYRVVSESNAVLAAPEAWSQIKLEREEREAFAKAAHILRFGDADGNVSTTVQPGQLLLPRRPADQGEDLWRVFNVAQENSIRGGLESVRPGHRDANGRWLNPRRTTTRAVNGIDGEVKLNKALWVLAEEMAKLKRAA
jgi:Domain of unknown function (DUF932)